MPEALGRWVETGDIVQVDKVLSDLLDSYERDFAKHGGRAQFAKLSQIWNSIPTQLARENKKFVWGAVREGARAREYEDALEWLADAGLITSARLNTGGGIPLSAYDDLKAFKVYCLDVGLLRRMAKLDASAFAISDAIFSEFKGSFAENYVLQALLPQLDAAPRYWTNEKPRHEVDFLIQVGNDIVPVEVKSGEVVHSKSLKYYADKHAETTPLRVRYSLKQWKSKVNGFPGSERPYLDPRSIDTFWSRFPAVLSSFSCGFAGEKCGCFGGLILLVHFSGK